MWLVIVMGAVISLYSSFYFPVVDPRVHSRLIALLAIFIGLVIFMVLALDRPFRGDLGLPATPYQLIYDHLMSR
jgi:ABC-type Co2+ transport system permease subunit